MLRKLVEININIVRRLFVDVQSNRKRHKEISIIVVIVFVDVPFDPTSLLRVAGLEQLLGQV